MPTPFPLDPDGDVSAVVVAYRTPEELERCLASFERLRPRRVGEVVVVDNSADGSSGADERFPWIRYAANASNDYFRRGVNQGVRLATRRYVLLLNPDAYLTDSDSVAALADLLDREPGVGFVGPAVAGDDGLLAPQGERTPGLLDLVADKTYLNALWPRNPLRLRRRRVGVSREVSGPVETVTAAALLCRRDEFLALGGLDERARMYFEEHELARKYRRRGLRGYYLREAYVHHTWRRGGTQLLGPDETARLFAEAEGVYYRVVYGAPGTALHAALALLQRALRALAGRRR